jgi:hypothetical protein
MNARPACAPSLAKQMQQQADDIHARRSAEIKQLAPLLARFEELVPALAERGLKVHAEMFSRRNTYVSDGYGPRRNVLRIAMPMFMDNQTGTQRWLDAFTALGFSIVKASDANTAWPNATLKRGHLLVNIDVPRAPAAIAKLGTPLESLAA